MQHLSFQGNNSQSNLEHFHSSFSPFLGPCLIVHKKNTFDTELKLINVNSSLCSEKQFPLKNSSKWALGEGFNYFIAPGVIPFTQYWTANETRND